MKKVLLVLLGILLATSVSFAAVSNEILEETTLTIAGGMAATSDTVYIGDNQKTATCTGCDTDDFANVTAYIVAQR